MPAMTGLAAGAAAFLLGIGVLFLRYRRRERYVALMPLAPLGYGLVAIGLLLALGVEPGWVAALAVGVLILAARRVPFALLWEGRISTRVAALMYSAVLPVAVLVVVAVLDSVSWVALVIAGVLFVTSYGFSLVMMPAIVARKKNGDAAGP